jgi:hypothetical protein
MKKREDVVIFIRGQLDSPDKGSGEDGGDIYAEWHYGKIELRRLLDYLYEGAPKTEKEML